MLVTYCKAAETVLQLREEMVSTIIYYWGQQKRLDFRQIETFNWSKSQINLQQKISLDKEIQLKSTTKEDQTQIMYFLLYQEGS